MNETPMEVGADDFNRRVLGSVDFQALNNEFDTILNRGADEDNGHEAMKDALEGCIRELQKLENPQNYTSSVTLDAIKALTKAKGKEAP